MATKAKKPSRLGLYEPMECIGQGSMGEVWLCRDDSLDRPLVVKRMQLALRNSEDMVRRFSREVQAMASLDHPSVVQIHSFWKEEGTLLLSMEHIHGRNLREILEILHERGLPCRFPPWLACHVLRQTLSALAHAHSRGIIHRDLKPTNLMIDYHGRVKLLDFGVARLSDQDMTQPGTLIGTTAYMSPEQSKGLVTGPASDLFSLGIVAWELLHGVHPFRGETPEETLLNIQEKGPQRSQEKIDLPAALEPWLVQMLRKDPRKRFASAQDALRKLDSILNPLPRDLESPCALWMRSLRKELALPSGPYWPNWLARSAPVLIAGLLGLLLGLGWGLARP